MICECTSDDLPFVVDFASRSPEANLFILGDIEAYGLGDDLSVWTIGTRREGPRAVILRMFDNYVIATGSDPQTLPEVAEVIVADAAPTGPACINGDPVLVEAMRTWYPTYHLESCHLASCRALADVPVSLPPDVTLREVTSDDVPAMVEVLASAGMASVDLTDPNGFDRACDRARENLAHGLPTFGAFRGRDLLAVASTTGMCRAGAMVTGVATRPEERGQGLATAAVRTLCEHCLGRGCGFMSLFYTNPVAAGIYLRLGFEPIGSYGLLLR